MDTQNITPLHWIIAGVTTLVQEYFRSKAFLSLITNIENTKDRNMWLMLRPVTIFLLLNVKPDPEGNKNAVLIFLIILVVLFSESLYSPGEEFQSNIWSLIGIGLISVGLWDRFHKAQQPALGASIKEEPRYSGVL